MRERNAMMLFCVRDILPKGMFPQNFVLLLLYRTNVVARRDALPDDAISCFKKYFSFKGGCFTAKEQERGSQRHDCYFIKYGISAGAGARK